MSPIFRAGAAADLSFDGIGSNIAFTEVVVQRDFRTFQRQQPFPFGFCLVLKRLVESGKQGYGLAQFIEMPRLLPSDRHRGCSCSVSGLHRSPGFHCAPSPAP